MIRIYMSVANGILFLIKTNSAMHYDSLNLLLIKILMQSLLTEHRYAT